MNAKYIIIDGVSPVLFGATLTHKEVSRVAGGKPITGAGFCSVHRNDKGVPEVSVWGKSVSLGDMVAKAEDGDLIARTIFAD